MGNRKRIRRQLLCHLRAIGVILIAILAAVLLNLAAAQIEERLDTRLDVSGNRLFSISAETREMLSALTDDVKIYTLFSDSAQTTTKTLMRELLKHYASCAHVTVANYDILVDPSSVDRFRASQETISNNSIIVCSADETRVRVIPGNELFDYTMDYTTQSYTKYDFVGEDRMNRAIAYVIGEDTATVYLLQGHGEPQAAKLMAVMNALKVNNYDVAALNLAQNAQLAPHSILLVVEPQKDLSDAEYEVLTAYLRGGGSLYYASSYGTGKLSNFERVLNQFGIQITTGLLVEDIGSIERYFRNQLYLMPKLCIADAQENSAIHEFGASDFVVLPQSRGILAADIQPLGVTYTPLAVTSSAAYVKGRATSASALEKSAGDTSGQFAVIASSQFLSEAGTQSRAVCIGNAMFLTTDSLFDAYSNRKLLLAPMKWLAGRNDEAGLYGKPMGAYQLLLPSNALYQALSAGVIALVPTGVLLAGLLVWRRRKKR